MKSTLLTKLNVEDKKAIIALMLCVVAFIVLTLIQDMLRSHLRNTAFYLSESLMFSSFWWLCAPLLFAQYVAVKRKIIKPVLLILLPVIIHLFTFPLLVWAISSLFYYHTFAVSQTLRYTLSEHLYQLILLYAVPVLAYLFLNRKTQPAEQVILTGKEDLKSQFIDTILVADGNKKLTVLVSEVFYFAASSPYINIHLEGKKYLHNETLKSISLKLNGDQFVRVHKSIIVNMAMVACYATRLNGDYDLTLKNNVILRVSRNYAADFKNRFNKAHQLTTK